MVKNEHEAQKFDEDKPPMALLDSEFLEGVAKVMGFGAKKYAAHNWRNGIAVSRLVSAALRHLAAINRGENNDQETNLQHAYHLGCCAMFLAWMLEHRKDYDDRWVDKKPDNPTWPEWRDGIRVVDNYRGAYYNQNTNQWFYRAYY
jgi:hypothetical protein